MVIMIRFPFRFGGIFNFPLILISYWFDGKTKIRNFLNFNEVFDGEAIVFAGINSPLHFSDIVGNPNDYRIGFDFGNAGGKGDRFQKPGKSDSDFIIGLQVHFGFLRFGVLFHYIPILIGYRTKSKTFLKKIFKIPLFVNSAMGI